LSPVSCLEHLSSAIPKPLRTGSQNRFILGPFCSNALKIFVLFLQMVWIIEFTKPNSQHKSAFFYPFCICRIPSTLLSMLKTFLLSMTVTLLSRYQSPVNCRRRNIKENLRHKVNYRYYCHFQAWNLCSYLKELDNLQSQGRGGGRIFKIAYLMENYIGTDDW